MMFPLRKEMETIHCEVIKVSTNWIIIFTILIMLLGMESRLRGFIKWERVS